jgi:molybdenum cofactor cytidylyltransferase
VTADRLARFDAALSPRVQVPHDEAAIAEALRAAPGEVLLILTGSATSDAQDVAPAGLRAAGGAVAHYGMPVDPGNLLFLGALGEKPVIGLPGCARSPSLNGADWVLERVLCGVEIGPREITAMGVGGLLKESPARPQPRDQI